MHKTSEAELQKTLALLDTALHPDSPVRELERLSGMAAMGRATPAETSRALHLLKLVNNAPQLLGALKELLAATGMAEGDKRRQTIIATAEGLVALLAEGQA